MRLLRPTGVIAVTVMGVACLPEYYYDEEQNGKYDVATSVEIKPDVPVMNLTGAVDKVFRFQHKVPEGVANFHVIATTGTAATTDQSFCVKWRLGDSVYSDTGKYLGANDSGCNFYNRSALMLDAVKGLATAKTGASPEGRGQVARSGVAGTWNISVGGFARPGAPANTSTFKDVALKMHYDARTNMPTQFATKETAVKLGTGKGVLDCYQLKCDPGGDGFPNDGWGWFDSNTEVDFFSYGMTTAAECVRYRIVPPKGVDLTVTSFNPAGTQIEKVNSGGAGAIEVLKLTANAGPGRYSFSVQATSGMSQEPYYVDFLGKCL